MLAKVSSCAIVGLDGALVHPDLQAVEAPRGISFEMENGELLGLIGPNGAGKSTTIKILTGILFPSSGAACVLGFVPWEQRRPLAYQIGAVFGQRPQLWYHLPALDTFCSARRSSCWCWRQPFSDWDCAATKAGARSRCICEGRGTTADRGRTTKDYQQSAVVCPRSSGDE